MDDDGYHTQQRRHNYQRDGRTGSRGGESGPQRVRIYLPTSATGVGSSSVASPYADYGQGDETTSSTTPQVIRILPRAVYNLKNDHNFPVTARRGSVDTGLAHVVRMGRGSDGGPQVIHFGGPGHADASAAAYEASGPRVIRIGQGQEAYYPDSSSGPQVIRIGPSGRILSPTAQPYGQPYYVQRPQELDTRQSSSSSSSSGVYPSSQQSGVRVYTTGVPYSSYHGGPESPRIIAISTPQAYPSSGSQSPSLRYTTRPRPEGGGGEAEYHGQSSEWQGQQLHDQHPLRAYVQSPSGGGYSSSNPGYRTIAGHRSCGGGGGGMDSPGGSRVTYRNGVNDDGQGQQGESRGYPPQRLHLRDAGRSGSREMFFLGPNPVSIQMGGGGAGNGAGGTRRGSLGVVQVIPMRIEQLKQQQPQMQQRQSQSQQPQAPQQQQSFVYTTTSYQDGRPRGGGGGGPDADASSSSGGPQVIRGRVITSGSDRMGEFDKIIAESIRQFLIQKQGQQQQQQQQQQYPQQQQYQQQQQYPQQQQYQQQYQSSSGPWYSDSGSGEAQRPANVEVSEVHIPCIGGGGGGGDAQSETGSGAPEEDRNLFNKYKFKFDSIGNFSRSNSRDDGLGAGVGGGGGGESGDTGSGNWSKGGGGRGAPVAIFRFNDFDDMVARMMELRQASQTQSGGDDAIGTSHDQLSVQPVQHQQHQMAPEQQTDNRQNYEVAPSSFPGQVQRSQMNVTRETLRHKIEEFNSNNHGLIMSLEQEGATFHGFIRVQMNLIRPVEMEVPTQPPTLYDVLNHNPDNSDNPETTATADNRPQPTTDNAQTTFFYLPKDTSKVIHINSNTTTKEVIKTLLTKFKIKDNPLKFALYHKQGTDDDSASMRRLNEEELPLPMCLLWTDGGMEGLARNKFVLQENDTGEILWDAFSLPELENFLMFLNREEDEYVKELKSTYRLLKVQLQRRLEELKRD